MAEKWAQPLTAAMARYEINTPTRQAAFLAQVMHESARFTTLVENFNYRADRLVAVFPGYFDEHEALAYARQPSRIASRVYANRMGNGDEASGDGWKYRGRGLIQITGRGNYFECGVTLGMDLIADPDKLLDPDMAAMSAACYWKTHGLNELADAGSFSTITKRINGGLNGQPERLALLGKAKIALGVA
jgi:putative chitinase